MAILAILVIAGTSAAWLLLSVRFHQGVQLRHDRLKALRCAESGAMKVWNDMYVAAEEDVAGIGVFDDDYYDGLEIQGSMNEGKDGDWSVTIEAIAGTDDWRLTSTGTIASPVGQVDDTGTPVVQRTIELILLAITEDPNGPYEYALFATSDFTTFDTPMVDSLFTDSWDSSASAYSAVNSPAGSFAEAWANNDGGIGGNANITLGSSGNEIHGGVDHGPGAGATIAGDVELNTTELGDAIGMATVASTHDIGAVQASNHNGAINGQSTYPGWPPYSAWTQSLTAGAGVHVRLGTNDGIERTYYFTQIYAHSGGVIEFIGPSVVYIDGIGIQLDDSDGVGQFQSTLDADQVQFYLTDNAQHADLDAHTDLASGELFSTAFYAPDTELTMNGPIEVGGSYVVKELAPTAGGAVKIHYDEDLRLLGAPPSVPVLGFEAVGWHETAP